MNALLVYPEWPDTYWSFKHALPFEGKRSAYPPLGLLTIASQLPGHWKKRLIDTNVKRLSDSDLKWADVVMLSGMLVHRREILDILKRCRARGLKTVVGGPITSSVEELPLSADHVVVGEAEDLMPDLVAGLETGAAKPLYKAHTLPDMSRTPLPDLDLVNLKPYSAVGIQYSRGCPFNCEFCDIIELFGRNPRTKSPAQVVHELSTLRDGGWRGSVFFVDDNFIANRREAAKMLPEVARWQDENGRPFEFYTEASVDLATQPKLIEAMVQAGFSTVFLGIETPSPEALRETQKLQNLRIELHEAVERLTRAGLEVFSGFIVGFDSDGPGIFEVQRAFIESLPVAAAMIGVLTALPSTQLWRRLEKEGRLRYDSNGDQFSRPNFQPVLDELALLEGYRGLLAALYQPAAYYARCTKIIEQVGKGHAPALRPGALRMLLSILLHVGLLSPQRRHFWRLMGRALRRPHTLPRALALSVQGEHFIRYTREEVLPRIEDSLREVARERSLGIQPALKPPSTSRASPLEASQAR
jgi:radical SAM superfamily enzyme YgiQ (UPF0313 family)